MPADRDNPFRQPELYVLLFVVVVGASVVVPLLIPHMLTTEPKGRSIAFPLFVLFQGILCFVGSLTWCAVTTGEGGKT